MAVVVGLAATHTESPPAIRPDAPRPAPGMVAPRAVASDSLRAPPSDDASHTTEAPDGGDAPPAEVGGDEAPTDPDAAPELVPAEAEGEPISPLPAGCQGAAVRRLAGLQRRVITGPDWADVPSASRALLSAIKDGLVEHVTACLSALPADAERGVVAATLRHSLTDAAVATESIAGLGAHSLTWSRLRPQVSVFTASLRLACGADDLAIVFERTPAGLRRSLVVRVDGYTQIHGGNLGLELTLTRGGDDFAIATTAASPWCSSCWRTLRYQVFTRGPDGTFSRAAAGQDSAHVCSGVSVDARPGSVRFDYLSWDHVGDEIRRPRQRAFTLAGSTATPAAPRHRAPVDAVAAFLDADWMVARAMLERPDGATQAAHAELRRDHARGRWRATPEREGSAVTVRLDAGRDDRDEAPRFVPLTWGGDRWVVGAPHM